MTGALSEPWRHLAAAKSRDANDYPSQLVGALRPGRVCDPLVRLN